LHKASHLTSASHLLAPLLAVRAPPSTRLADPTAAATTGYSVGVRTLGLTRTPARPSTITSQLINNILSSSHPRILSGLFLIVLYRITTVVPHLNPLHCRSKRSFRHGGTTRFLSTSHTPKSHQSRPSQPEVARHDRPTFLSTQDHPTVSVSRIVVVLSRQMPRSRSRRP
jgi:hypothetical protein